MKENPLVVSATTRAEEEKKSFSRMDLHLIFPIFVSDRKSRLFLLLLFFFFPSFPSVRSFLVSYLASLHYHHTRHTHIYIYRKRKAKSKQTLSELNPIPQEVEKKEEER